MNLNLYPVLDVTSTRKAWNHGPQGERLREVIEQIAEDIERIPREYCGDGAEFDQQIEQMYPGR